MPLRALFSLFTIQNAMAAIALYGDSSGSPKNRAPGRSFLHSRAQQNNWRVAGTQLPPPIRTLPPVILKVLRFFFVCCLSAGAAVAADPWAPWLEPDFPFFSSTLDLRDVDPQSKPNNITPRGIVLNLGNDCWACFDTELLRVAAIWSGSSNGVTEAALAQTSYQKGIKTIGGQSKLPKPDGKIWLTNGVYPGWQMSEAVSYADPRTPQPSLEEPGRGPLPESVARFVAVRLAGRQIILEYTVAGAAVREWMSVRKQPLSVQRNFGIAPSAKTLTLIIGRKAGANNGSISISASSGVEILDDPQAWVVRVPPHEKPIEFAVVIANEPRPTVSFEPAPSTNTARWPHEPTTHAALSSEKSAYVIDEVPLPLDNPWRRSVRLCEIGFLKDGTAAAATIDGDVWLVRGLGKDLGEVKWKRFTSGLHEPMALAIRDNQIFVFDRNGIWRLRDTNNDGEADVHELFSNVFPQSAETREFPNSLKLAPDNSFVIAKGGQQASTISKLNGSVLRVAADGKSFTELGFGFRQPFAGVHPRTGMVTASDQEGHYVPTTPLYILDRPEYHGYLSEILPREKYPAPIADPLVWIPHSVNPSAISQVWLVGANMGPLNDALIHVGFNRPELFRVLINNRASKPQAAVVSVARNFDVPALNATVNPTDGFLYVTGFQMVGWGTTAKSTSNLARLRYTGAPVTLPREVIPMDQGILLRFDTELDPVKASDPASYSIESWHYKRTYQYGSPHLKADGTPGQDWITPSSAYLSKDGRTVFVGVPGMKPVEQMRIGWSLATPDGVTFEENAYFTPYELPKFDPKAEGFGEITVNLTPAISTAKVSVPATVEEGERLYKMMGCMACHSIEPDVQLRIGPPWKGLFGSTRDLAKAAPTVADEAYLRESILTPAAKIVKGYEKVEAGMPVYSGVLTDSQVDSIILYIKTLK
jgi:cytochrome c2